MPRFFSVSWLFCFMMIIAAGSVTAEETKEAKPAEKKVTEEAAKEKKAKKIAESGSTAEPGEAEQAAKKSEKKADAQAQVKTQDKPASPKAPEKKAAPVKTMAETGKSASETDEPAAAEAATTQEKAPEKVAVAQEESAPAEGEPEPHRKLQESPLSIARAAICTGVQDREPQGEASTFPGATQKLYCFSHVRGARGDTEIRHTWYFNGQAVGSVPLDVRSSSWRTYSSKTIPQNSTGAWKVEISDAASGKILETLDFTVE